MRWLFRFEVRAPAGIAAIAFAALVMAAGLRALAPWAVGQIPPVWAMRVSSVQVQSGSLAVIVDRVIYDDFKGSVQVDVRQIATATDPGEPAERTISLCHGPVMTGIRFRSGTPFASIISDGGPRDGQVRDLNWYLGLPPNRSCDIVGSPGAYRADFTYFYPWPQGGWLKGMLEFRAGPFESNPFFAVAPEPISGE
jgi:hypothetical protein